MRHHHDGAPRVDKTGIAVQETTLQSRSVVGVEVFGRFVEQQYLRR